MRRLTFVALVALLTAFAGMGAGADGPTLIASGLDNPRHMATGAGGALYIAEAGVGGAGPCFPGPEGADVCFGESGAITMVRGQQQSRIVTGLPSIAEEGGIAAIGPHSVGIGGRGELFVSVGLGADPAMTDGGGLLEGVPAATVMRVHGRSGQVNVLANLGMHEALTNGDGGILDSNPYGMAVVGRGVYVTDAGGNTLVRVERNGTMSTIASFAPSTAPPPFPPFPVDAVPTDVEVGPDGYLYVSQLTGFPFTKGAANVYRVGLDGSVSVAESGFTNIVDIAFDRDGNMYVAEIASDGLLAGPFGSVIKVAPDGTRTTVAAGLFAPGGVVATNDGVYVSVNSILPGAGEVWFYSH